MQVLRYIWLGVAAEVFAADAVSAAGAHSVAVVFFVGGGSGAAVYIEGADIGADASTATGAIAGVDIGAGVSMATGAIAGVAIFVDAIAVGAATMDTLRMSYMAIIIVIRAPG